MTGTLHTRDGKETFLVKFERPGRKEFVDVRAKDVEEAIPLIKDAYGKKYGGTTPKVGTDPRHGIINFD